MPNIAMVAALEREIGGLIKNWTRIQRDYAGREFTFFERDNMVAVCGGIGTEAARRAAEAVIGVYHPTHLQSVGFAGALHPGLRVGDIFLPAVVVDARDGSRTEIEAGDGILVTFMDVAGAEQKGRLAEAYGACAVDMESAAVAAAARAHGITFGVTKAISDDLGFEMPSMARFIDAEGQFKTASFVSFSALRPWMWKPVIMLARNSRKATQKLSAYLKCFRRTLHPPVIPAPAPSSITAAANALRSGGRE